MKDIKCPICQEYHQIDKDNWVQTCIGYYPLIALEEVFHNHFSQKTGKVITKGNTKGNTKNVRKNI